MVVEYIHALVEQAITPRQFVYELLINLCVRTNRLYQLHQMLQYQVSNIMIVMVITIL